MGAGREREAKGRREERAEKDNNVCICIAHPKSGHELERDANDDVESGAEDRQAELHQEAPTLPGLGERTARRPIARRSAPVLTEFGPSSP